MLSIIVKNKIMATTGEKRRQRNIVYFMSLNQTRPWRYQNRQK